MSAFATSRPDRLFGLSYLPPRTEEGRTLPPELVFTLESGVAEWTEKMILESELHTRFKGDYLEGKEDSWRGQEQQLWLFDHPERREFGYAGVGYVYATDHGTEYRFPLQYELVQHTALTVHVLSIALRCLVTDQMEHVPRSNRAQLLDFVTRCNPRAEAGYGHGVTGHIYPAFRQWLREQSSKTSDGHLPAIEKAMAETYGRLAHPQARVFAKECSARLNAKGRFLLECPGNACDIAIYPEGDRHGEDVASDFSCHNLDAACQQLTLLAGLAVLHELAASDLG